MNSLFIQRGTSPARTGVFAHVSYTFRSHLYRTSRTTTSGRPAFTQRSSSFAPRSRSLTPISSSHAQHKALGGDVLVFPAALSGANNPGKAAHVAVEVFWDLDNICPSAKVVHEDIWRVRQAVSRFGEIVNLNAYANRTSIAGVKAWTTVLTQEEEKAVHTSERISADGQHPKDAGTQDQGLCSSARTPLVPSVLAPSAGFAPRERADSKNMRNARRANARAASTRSATSRMKERTDQRSRWAQELAASWQHERVLSMEALRITVVPTIRQAADKALKREVHALLEEVLHDGGVAAVASTYVCIVSNDTGMAPLIKEVHMLGAKPLVISNNKTLRPLAIASSSWRDLGTWIYHSDN